VIILAGKDETPFILHKTPLARKSPIFWADLASDPGGENVDETPVRLPDIEARYFRVYTHWVYSSQLDIALLGHHRTTVQRPLAVRDAEKARLGNINGELVDDLMRLWRQVACLRDAPFQNIVSDELVRWLLDRRSLTRMSMKTFDFVDEYTVPEDRVDPLRRMCIDWADIELTSETNMRVLTETAPKWLVSGLLVSKMCGENGGWKEDPRRIPIKRRYHVPHHTEA
jgi:hypothetical protein